ncbi:MULTISPECIES: hypothetical protein [Pseudomonas syringae group genomosp. 2]|uniref:Plasmid replication protein RepB n=1 Tax=Pseudomonas amygdali pv. ulmi TaxID=251720 RepID=A0A0Q0D4M0_PSEA0|nr:MULTISPECIES: hypothetical protein [Pseudomonas syringae group genomosp. 2]KPZ12408.1 hypothetical protein ALO41_200163 [Pseudomonas amygdali pv. ulmi]
MRDTEIDKQKTSGRICNFVSTELLFADENIRPGVGDVRYVNLSEMRILYECGALAHATLAPSPMESGFIMIVKRKDGKEETMSTTKGERHKIYKSLEAASTDAKRIGFHEVTFKVK